MDELSSIRKSYRESIIQYFDFLNRNTAAKLASKLYRPILYKLFKKYEHLRPKINHILVFNKFNSLNTYVELVRPLNFKVGLPNGGIRYAFQDTLTVQEAFDRLVSLLSNFGIIGTFYGICVKHSPQRKRIWGVICNYPDEFKEAYIGAYNNKNYLNYEPALKRFLRYNDMQPVLWNYPEDREQYATLTKHEQDIQDLAWDNHFFNGVTIPLCIDLATSQPLAAAGICASPTMTRSEWNKTWEANKQQIKKILSQFHNKVMSIHDFEKQLEVQENYRELFNKMISVVKLNTLIENLDKTLETITSDLDETSPDKRMARLNEIYESARAHLRETIGEEALAETKEVTKPDIELPTDREKYKDRDKKKGESAIVFLDRVWGDLLKEKRVYQFNLRKIDPTLVRAVKYEAENDDRDLSDHIPPKSVYVDLELAAKENAKKLKKEETAKKGGSKAAKAESTRLSGNKQRRANKR